MRGAVEPLEELYASSEAMIYGFVASRCGDRTAAEDVTAQVYVDAARAFADGKGPEVDAPWLVAVARRRLIDHWRRADSRRRRVAAILHERPVAAVADVEDERVARALADLPERQRAALVLRYMDDLSVGEVAEALELSYRAAESVLARGRASFRRAWEERS